MHRHRYLLQAHEDGMGLGQPDDDGETARATGLLQDKGIGAVRDLVIGDAHHFKSYFVARVHWLVVMMAEP